MEILSAFKYENLTQLVKSLGKYLFNHLSGATNYQVFNNNVEIDELILYQVPYEIIKKYNLQNIDETDVKEMEIKIFITTYQNKIRMNLIAEDEYEVTLGHMTFNMDKYKDIDANKFFKIAKDKVESYIIRRLNAVFEGYEFLF